MHRKRLGISLLVSTDAASYFTTSVPDIAVAAPVDRKKGGRPEGKTDARKKTCELAVTAEKIRYVYYLIEIKRKQAKNDYHMGVLLVSLTV